ncbi:MAG: endonuclease III [Candidatus Woykebacteria bacterium]
MHKTNSINKVLNILQKTYAGQKGAVELGDPYKVLFATIISQRNKDELTEIVAARLFKKYPSVESLSKADTTDLAKIIYPSGFYNTKGRVMVEAAKEIADRFAENIPNRVEELTSLPGVGRKTANCVLVYGYNLPAIIVDTHVHRISQRLGWLKSKNPEETEVKLGRIVPKKYWKIINTVMVKHGKSICLPIGPKCHICPILNYCPYGQNRVKS